MKPKLLMIYLLRSSAAALATHSRGGGVVGVSVGTSGKGLLPLSGGRRTLAASSSSYDDSSSSSTSLHATLETTPTSEKGSSPHLLTSGHIAFRLARRTDVPQIQKCNLATLPENYNANFYVNHMRTWPELTLVAEHIPEGCDVREEEEDEDPNRITPIRDYIRGRQQPSSQRPRKEIVGYILGKVEDRPLNVQRQIFPPSRAVPLYEDEETLLQYMNGNSNGARFPSPRQQHQRPPMEKIGHVTSLAVHNHARRLGIASSLLHQLHYHLHECYGADSVGLHVRISNRAAVRLYCEEGYDVADIIPLYYGDGEDAYFMRKDLGSVISEGMPQQHQQQQNNGQRQWRRGEKERNEWLNRDATRGGSFFDGRKSMRDSLSQEERAWVNTNNINGDSHRNNHRQPPSSAPTSLSGQFRRSFRSFFNGGEQMQTGQTQRQRNQFTMPPWEVGPEGLRLPRYSRVARAPQPQPMETNGRNGRSLKELVTNNQQEEVDEMRDDVIIENSYEEEEESLDARFAASGSV